MNNQPKETQFIFSCWLVSSVNGISAVVCYLKPNLYTYDFLVNSLKITFLNEYKFVCFHTVKYFQVLLLSTHKYFQVLQLFALKYFQVLLLFAHS